jgi:phosphatidylglycerol:prolipoprotein diacylglycerol transferase
MYPALPFGPITIPTGPLVALVAVTVGLEVAGRFGRRLHIAIDDVWNTGLLATLATVIVARLWNVIQFWGAYSAEPWLILSLRPSGFVWNAGLVAGIVVAYLYLLRRALPPLPVTVALASGILTALAIFTAGAFLTGTLVGLPSTAPWALPYFGVLRHPVALYYGLGFALLVVAGWLIRARTSAGRLLLFWLLGSGLLLLWLAAYEEGSRTFFSLRVNQILGLGLALAASLALAQSGRKTAPPVANAEVEKL